MTFLMGESSRKAAATIAGQGFNTPNKPKYDIPSLPQDITSLGDEELMDLFVSLTGWLDYIAVQVAMAQVDERAAQRSLDIAEASATAANWTGGRDDRVSIAKAKVATDVTVVRSREELDERHAYRKLAEALASNVERDAALVSRELTRRTSGGTPITRRASRWSS